MPRSHFMLLVLVILALSACAPTAAPRTDVPGNKEHPAQGLTTITSQMSAEITDQAPATTGDPQPARPAASNTLAASPPPSGSEGERLSYRYWRWWPVLPGVTRTTFQIYQHGLDLGVDRHAFTIIGDCQSMPPVFGGRYDHPGQYRLPLEYAYLQETIDRFRGSFDRTRVTVQNGFSVTAALSPLWADPEICQPGETPLDCELRVHRPIFVFITLGTNWNTGDAARHNEILARIIDQIIASGAVPILSTKGDNEEGDHSINLGIARLAAERDLPLWNYWRAIQELPNHGLDIARDGNYLSVAAWDVRSFSGLQVLDTLWRLLDPDGVPDPSSRAE